MFFEWIVWERNIYARERNDLFKYWLYLKKNSKLYNEHKNRW